MSTRNTVPTISRKSATPSQVNRRQPLAEMENQSNIQPRKPRERRASAKIIEQQQEDADAAARKLAQTLRRDARVRKSQLKRDKAAGITQDPNNEDLEEHLDTVFTSSKVASKPAQRTITAALRAVAAASAPVHMPTPVKRSSKVPTAPSQQLFLENDPASEDSAMDDYEQDFEDDIPEDLEDVSGELSEDDGYTSGLSLSHYPNSPPPKPLPKPLPGHMVLNLRTPSTAPINKRVRSNSLDIMAAAPATVKARKINENTGRPKASDYDDVAKQAILTAGNVYRCLISTVNGFPDSGTEIEFVCQAWKRANEMAKLDPPIDMTPDIGKIIKQRGSQVRGEAKSKTASMVETMYGFSSAQGRRTVAANRDLAELLKDEKGFLYKELTADTRKGIYKHAIIQTSVNKMWFKNQRDEGVVYSDMFNPMPIPAIALVLTAIECNIDEWTTGTKTDIAFYADDYRTTYLKHIESLKAFGEATAKHDLLKKLQKRLHTFGRQHSGAAHVALTDDPAIPVIAFLAALKEYEENGDEYDEDDEIAAFSQLPGN